MLRHFATVTLVAIVAVTLTSCGIKGPLRLPTPETPKEPVSGGNPEARPPLLPSEPPPSIAPAQPAKP